MPRRSVRTRRRSFGCLSFAIGALAVAALALICAIVISDELAPSRRDAPVQADEGRFVDVNNLPESQMVLKAATFSDEYLPSDATPMPAPSPTPSPTPEPTAGAETLGEPLRPTAASDDMLPVFKKANTNDKVIAITLDECSGAQIMTNFVNMANRFNAKLTLFPTGENILKNGMGPLLKACVFSYGFEVENRGYSGIARLYRDPDSLMVQEIWKQSVALNFVLGVRYEPHFLRMYGGLGENDPRTHAYLKQQGYLGVAHWTVSGSDVPVESIADKLTPGGIYFFKSNEDDGRRMYALMRAARQQGYRMVTLNELFGYEANAYADAGGSLLSDTMPEFTYDASELYDLFPGDAAWAVTLLQQRLVRLGYMRSASVDGIFGNDTADALRLFQANSGLAASGAADVNTQRLLYDEEAAANPNPLPADDTPGESAPQTELREETLVESTDPAAQEE